MTLDEAADKLKAAQEEYDTAHKAYVLCVGSMNKLRDEMRDAGKKLTAARRDYRTTVHAMQDEVSSDDDGPTGSSANGASDSRLDHPGSLADKPRARAVRRDHTGFPIGPGAS